MRNNKLILRTIFIISVAVIFTALPGYCSPSVPLKQTIIKFLFAMGGVALSSFLIFLGLSVYNRFFVEKSDIKEDDSLSTPDNVQDSIIFFIKKNKLK